MKRSEQITELGKALASFQAEVVNPKNSAVNPYHNHRYAPLGEILATVRPVLGKHGLAVAQDTKVEGETVVITTTLLHESGEFMETDPLILPAGVKGQVTAQTIGAAITYGRRYQLSALLGISSEDDDDANSISVDQSKQQAQKKNQKQQKQSQRQTQQQQESRQTGEQSKQKKKHNTLHKTGYFSLVNYKTGTSQSGVPYAKLEVVDEETGEKMEVLKPGVEALAKTIPEDKPFHMEWEEQNGFRFIRSVNGKTLADQEKGDLR